MSGQGQASGDRGAIPFTEYLTVVLDTEDVKRSLQSIVSDFITLYAAHGSPLDKQKVWNMTNRELQRLDRAIQDCVRSDIHNNGLTVDFSA